MNTSAVLATVTDKQEYKDWYATFWRYIDEYLIDHEHGSWFHQLDKDNHVIGTVWPGKSDLYHALQCTFIPRLNPAVSVAPALKQATGTPLTRPSLLPKTAGAPVPSRTGAPALSAPKQV